MRLIELTNRANGEPALVNVEKILRIEPAASKGSEVSQDGLPVLRVRDSPAEIIEKIRDAEEL